MQASRFRLLEPSPRPPPDERVQLPPKPPRRLHVRSTTQRKPKLSSKKRVELADGDGIDQNIAANAQEAGPELAADVLQRLADHIRARAAVDDDVVAGGFDPVNLAVIDEHDALAVPDGDAADAQLVGECLERGEAGFETGGEDVESLFEKGEHS